MLFLEFSIMFFFFFFALVLSDSDISAVSMQGDAGQPGLPGTMGPAGKTVSMSSRQVVETPT